MTKTNAACAKKNNRRNELSKRAFFPLVSILMKTQLHFVSWAVVSDHLSVSSTRRLEVLPLHR